MYTHQRHIHRQGSIGAEISQIIDCDQVFRQHNIRRIANNEGSAGRTGRHPRGYRRHGRRHGGRRRWRPSDRRTCPPPRPRVSGTCRRTGVSTHTLHSDYPNEELVPVAARCVTQVSLRCIGCCTSEGVNPVTGAAMPCLYFRSGVVPHYAVRGDALWRPTARNVLWRCADPPLAPQQEVQYTEGSGSHPHLGAGLLRAGARPLRQLVHVCVRPICWHAVILLVSDCMHQRKPSASLCRFGALSSAILPALPHGSREYSTLQDSRQPHGTSANAASRGLRGAGIGGAEKGFAGSKVAGVLGVPSLYGEPSELLLYSSPCTWMVVGKRILLLNTTLPPANSTNYSTILRSVCALNPVAMQSSCLAHKLT